MHVWFLEGYLDQGKTLKRVRISPFPFKVGRQDDLQLALDSAGISRIHAQFELAGTSLVLRDLGSTNGSYVNRKRLTEPKRLHHGDIIHLADAEFRIIEETTDDDAGLGNTRIGISTLSNKLPQGAREFQHMLLHQQVAAVYQPILNRDLQAHATELLGRGAHPDLPEAPGPLFRLAESLDMEVMFSEMLRNHGLREAYDKARDQRYFFNIHPLEMKDTKRLLESLQHMRSELPELDCVLEVHEGAVTDLDQMRDVQAALNELNIGLAYDDFGAGQARLVELAEVPPDYVKFDMALIRDLDQATKAKRSMIKMLVNFAKELEIATLAEGISREGEADACHELGFEFFQGFYYGEPKPIEE